MTAPSKIQQDRRLTRTCVKPVWKGTTITTNSNGYEEAYSIAPDGFIWCCAVEGESGRVGDLICTGLRANTFTLGKSAEGRNVVIAAVGADVYFVAESRDLNQRWSVPHKVSFPAAQKSIDSVEKIFAQSLAGNLLVCVQTRHLQFEKEDAYQFWEAVWTGEGMVLCHAPLRRELQSSIWLDELADMLR